MWTKTSTRSEARGVVLAADRRTDETWARNPDDIVREKEVLIWKLIKRV